MKNGTLFRLGGVSFFELCLKTYPLPRNEYIDVFLILLYKGKVEVKNLLEKWEHNLTTSATLHFSDLINHGYDNFNIEKLGNAFSDEILSEKMNFWIKSKNTRTVFSEAILNIIEKEKLDEIKYLELECTFNVLNY